jgi:hypothetical protein
VKIEILCHPEHPVGLMVCLRLLLLVLLFSASSLADVPKVAVLVDPALAKDPLAAVLEQQLAGRRDLTLVERTQLKLVIDEATLRQLSGDDRGARLKAVRAIQVADALVIIRPGGSKPELALCETRRGLRLLRLPLADESSVNHAAAEVARRLPALMKQDAQVWAVPPLISRNLTTEHDHLKSSLARVIEETLTARGDILCVELDEAKAFADEITLGGPELSRNLPYYVFGEFRHATRKPDAAVNLSLELTQGSRSLQRLASDNMPADQLSGAVTKHVAVFIETTGGQPRQTDPGAEATLLTKRAAAVSALSMNDEAVALIEAAILLQPQDVKLRRDALVYYERQMEALTKGRSLTSSSRMRRTRPQEIADAITAAGRYTRSLEHLYAAYAASLDGPNHDSESGRLQQYSAYWILSLARGDNRTDPPPELAEAIRTMVEAERERMSPLLARELMKHQSVAALNSRYYFWYATRFEPKDPMGPLLGIAKLLSDEERHGPGLWYLHKRAMHINWVMNDATWDEIDTALIPAREAAGRLRSLPQANAPKWAAYLEAHIDALRSEQVTRRAAATTRKATTKPASTQPVLAHAKLMLKPLNLAWPGRNAADVRLNYWVPVGPDVAVVGDSSSLAWLRDGQLKRITLPGAGYVLRVAFDGKYVWAIGKSVPLLIDPATEKVQPIATEKLFPPSDNGLQIIPVAPKQAAVFGAFGGNPGKPARSWIAMMTVGDDFKATAELVHESIEVPPAVDLPAMRTPLPTEVFSPMVMFTTITAKDQTVTQVHFDGRLFEVATRKLTALQRGLNIVANTQDDEGAFWSLKPPGSRRDTQPLQLIRRHPPEMAVEVIEPAVPFHAQNSPPIELFFLGDRLVLRKENRFFVYDRASRQFAELPIPKDLLNKTQPGEWWVRQFQWVRHAGGVLAYNPETGKIYSATIEMPEKHQSTTLPAKN